MQYLKLSIFAALASFFIQTATAQSSPHVEACLERTWGFLKAIEYDFGAINTCAYPVAVWFKRRNGQMVEKTVQPGEIFRTDLSVARFEADRRNSGWVAAVCRAGEVPNPAISEINWQAILKGEYECREP
jgi:hypothetical protein